MLCLVSRTHQESQVVLKTEHDKEIEKWREYKVLPSARGGRMCWAGQARQTRPSMSNFRDLSSLTLPPPTPRASRPSQTATLSLLYIISLKIIECYMSSKHKVLIIVLQCCIMNIIFGRFQSFERWSQRATTNSIILTVSQYRGY